MENELQVLLDRVRERDRYALARALSIAEREPERLWGLLEQRQRSALTVAVAGPPGAGKSTLLGAVAAQLANRDYSVAILAFDPVSLRSGGALLGDRVRMVAAVEDPRVFVRSLAARPAGSDSALPWLLALLDLYGFDFVFLEAVGAGQEVPTLALEADLILLVLVPGLGDGIQLLKAGILELADLIVINKADRPGSEELLRDVSAYFRLIAQSETSTPLVLRTSADRGEGIVELVDALTMYRARLPEAGHGPERDVRLNRRLLELYLTRCAREAITRLLDELPSHSLSSASPGSERALLRELARRLTEKADSLPESE